MRKFAIPLAAIVATLIYAAAAFAAAAADPQPTPSPLGQCQIPLSDGTTTTAAFMPGPNGTLSLVYIGPQNSLVILTIGGDHPTPPPNPIPPPDPTPQLYRFAIIENPTSSTPAQRMVMSSSTWRGHRPANVICDGILPTKLTDPATGETPAPLKRYYAAAASLPLPRLIIFGPQPTPVFNSELPATPQRLLEILTNPEATKNAAPRNQRPDSNPCPNGTCPTTQGSATHANRGLLAA